MQGDGLLVQKTDSVKFLAPSRADPCDGRSANVVPLRQNVCVVRITRFVNNLSSLQRLMTNACVAPRAPLPSKKIQSDVLCQDINNDMLAGSA